MQLKKQFQKNWVDQKKLKPYKFYDVTISDSKNNYVLTYQLEKHRPAKIWANLIKECTVDELRNSLNPWRGIHKNWNEKVLELTQLINDINRWLPNTITHEYDDLDPQDSLNKLHIHFPEHKNEKDPLKKYQLSKYNDLIHEMESLLKIKKEGKERLSILLCPDNTKKENLIDNDFKYFTVNSNFGDLKLHYCHVGRHPWEIFLSKDINCPKDQIVPQYQISAYHKLVFSDMFFDFNNFKTFYNSSNIEWPYQLSDKKLAVGYITLGKLIYLNYNPYSKIETYIKVRSCNKIVNWKIY